MTTFSKIVDAADSLSVNEPLALVEILRRRIAEKSRQQLLTDVQDARTEFAAGKARVATAREIMDEAGGEA